TGRSPSWRVSSGSIRTRSTTGRSSCWTVPRASSAAMAAAEKTVPLPPDERWRPLVVDDDAVGALCDRRVPPGNATRLIASCAVRLGRYPNDPGWKSASKTGSSMSLSAPCTTLSRIAGIERTRTFVDLDYPRHAFDAAEADADL